MINQVEDAKKEKTHVLPAIHETKRRQAPIQKCPTCAVDSKMLEQARRRTNAWGTRKSLEMVNNADQLIV